MFKLKNDFEYFLQTKFDGLFHGTKDQVEDAYENWSSQLDVQELIDYADEFANDLLLKSIEEIGEYKVYEDTNKGSLPEDEQRINDLLTEIQQDLKAKYLK